MTPPETYDVVAFAAHPDDAEAACGGLLAKLVKRGYRVAICDATQGELASNGSVEQRRSEAVRAAAVLGVQGRWNLELPDGGLRATDPEQLRRLVIAMREARPRLIVAPHPAARHPDHVELAGLVHAAQFWCGVRRFAPEAPAVARPVLLRALDYHPLTPSFVVDIRAELASKLESLRCYASQFERHGDSVPTHLNDPAYLQRIETNARTYGQLIGSAAGEPYVIDAGVPLEDPVAALAPDLAEVRP